MSQIIEGGQADAIFLETSIQEFTPNQELIFNWPGLEHLRDGLPYLEIDDPKSGYFRFPHMNAIEVDIDGHFLVSSRLLSEVTKINRQTGEIIWRLVVYIINSLL